MIDLFVVFWSFMIFVSIFWYAALLFDVGVKGGREIKTLTEVLDAREDPEKKP